MIEKKEIIDIENKYSDMLKAFDNTSICAFIYYPQKKAIELPKKTCLRYQCNSYYSNMPESFIKECVYSEDQEKCRQLYKEIDEGNNNSHTELRNNKLDFCVRVTLTTIKKDESGNPLVAFGVIEDITDTFKNEQVIVQLKKFLNYDNDSNNELKEAINLIAISIGGLYFAIYHIWMDSHTYICLQEKMSGVLSLIGRKGKYEEAWNKYINEYVDKDDQDDLRNFVCYDTLQKRLKETNIISHTYRRINVGWTRGQFIVAKRDEKGNVTNLIYTVSDINEEIERETIKEKAIFESQHDSLTGVYNRYGFDVITQSDSLKDIPVGFALLDIDGFKFLNDTYGHTLGDKVLTQVVDLLSEVFRNDDKIFRLGGDEFGILLFNCDERIWDVLCNKIQRVHIAIENTISNHIPVTISLGVCFSKKGFKSEMINLADEALYHSKNNGRAGCTYIDWNHNVKLQWKDENISIRANNALASSNTGIFRLDFNSNSTGTPRLICSDMTKIIFGFKNSDTPEECYERWFNGISSDYKETLLKAKEKMLQGKHVECVYMWNHPKWGEILVRTGGTGHIVDGTQYINGYHHSLRDIEIVEKEDDSKLLFNALNKIHFAYYYINLERDVYYPFRDSTTNASLNDEFPEAEKSLSKFLKIFVKEEYREKMYEFCDFETLQKRLENEIYVECEFLSTSERGWCRGRFVPVKKNENGKITHVLFVLSSIDSLKQNELAKNKEINRVLNLHREAGELVIKAKIVALSLINKNNLLMEYWANKTGFDKNKFVSYKTITDHDSNYVDPLEKDQFIEQMDIENIKSSISIFGTYSFVFDMLDKDGNQRLFEYHFEDYKHDSNYIFCVIEDITEQAAYDKITDATNMNGFIHLSNFKLHTANKDDSFAIVAFNIHNFKAINSQYSSDGGDILLRKMYWEIENSFLNPMVGCREMADKFFFLINKNKMDYDELAKLCNINVIIGKISVQVKMDCGIYYIDDINGDVNDMIDKVRIALSMVKQDPAHFYVVYNDNMKKEYIEQAYVITNFHDSMAKRELIAVYQPIYDAKTKKIVSAEALVRWNHPEKGLMSPATFIPVLEKNGYISELDHYIGKTISKIQIQRYKEHKKCIPIAINLSRYDFYNADMLNEIIDIFRNNEILKDLIRLEITESAFIDIPQSGIDFLYNIRKLGCKIMVDDFGSGFSSLSTLAECDSSYVKLDMSFTKSIGKNHKTELIIISTIKAIHQMGEKIIAEGVETKEQYEFLRNNDCDYIQGYYFSKPLLADEFERIVENDD